MKKPVISRARRAAELRSDSDVIARLEWLFPEMGTEELMGVANGEGLTLASDADDVPSIAPAPGRAARTHHFRA